jgi:cytochrome P450
MTSLPLGISSYAVAGVAAALVIVSKLSMTSKLDAIPTVGSGGWLGSWLAGFKYLTNALDVMQEGYDKHKPAPFKVAELFHWIVVISSREHLEELWRAPDDTLSFAEALNDQLCVEHTMGHEIHHNPYPIPIVRSQLTRNLGALCLEIRDEIATAFDDVLDLRGNEWKSVPALSSVQKVVCRTTNRVLVGLPLCRDHGWIDLNVQYTIDVMKGGAVIGLLPDFLRPMAVRYFTNVIRSRQHGMKFLGPTIEARRKYLTDYGNEWADKPNDFLSWLMEEAEGPQLTVRSLSTYILAVNVAAIHSSSSSFTHALFYLAANPQYIGPLRDEVESIVEKEGWSKAAVDKMRKVDSFLKECQRMEGIDGATLTRKALKDFTFSDGTFIPKGTTIVAATRSIHLDGAFYENPHTFEPFRFADLRKGNNEGVKHQFVSTTAEYLAFGHGRHACPGRFFAANELKIMLAHIVATYDVALADGGTRPQSLRFATSVVPDPRAKVMFRRRVD